MDFIKFIKTKFGQLNEGEKKKVEEMTGLTADQIESLDKKNIRSGNIVIEDGMMDAKKTGKKKIKRGGFVKKAVSLVLVAGAIFSFTACGKDNNTEMDTEDEYLDGVITPVDPEDDINRPMDDIVSDEDKKYENIEAINSMIANKYGYKDARITSVETVTYDGVVKPTTDDKVMVSFGITVTTQSGEEKSGAINLFVPFDMYAEALRDINPHSPKLELTTEDLIRRPSVVSKWIKDMMEAGFLNASMKNPRETKDQQM